LLIAVVFVSCKKEKEETPALPLSFSSLMSLSDTIYVGTTTKVTATATGDNLSYSWSLSQSSLGDIIGSGSQITYGASPCCTGWNTIVCTVSNGSESQSKSVTIVVVEP
jgi:hypothetical protein